MAAQTDTTPSLTTQISHWIWGNPTIICKWTTMNRELEVRIIKQGWYTSVNLFNTRWNELWHSWNAGWGSALANIQTCIQRWRNQTIEMRLFRNLDPHRVDAIVVDLHTGRVGVFEWRNQQELSLGYDSANCGFHTSDSEFRNVNSGFDFDATISDLNRNIYNGLEHFHPGWGALVRTDIPNTIGNLKDLAFEGARQIENGLESIVNATGNAVGDALQTIGEGILRD